VATEVKKTFWLSQFLQKEKLFSLRIKLLITFTLLIVIPIAITGSIASFSNTSVMEHQATTVSPSVLHEISFNMNLLMGNIETASAQIIADPDLVKYLTILNNPDLQPADRKQISAKINDLFQPWLAINKSIKKIVVLSSQKHSLNYSFHNQEEFNKVVNSGWYKQAIALNGKPLWIMTHPELNQAKNYQLSCLRFIGRGERSIPPNTILIIDINRNVLNNIFSRALFSSGGKVYLLSPDQEWFRVEPPFHWDFRLKENRDKTVTRLMNSDWFQKLTANQNEVVMEMPGHKTTKILYHELRNSGWFLLGLIFKEEYTGPVFMMNYLYLAIGLFLGLLAIWGSLALVGKITKPLKSVLLALKAMESGDFTQKLPSEARNDEIGVLARAYNSMIDNLRRLISNVDQIAIKLSDIAAKIITVSQKVIGSSTNISGTLEEVAQAASEQAIEAFRCVSYMSTLTESIRIVNDCTSLIQQIKADILLLTAKGKVVLENLELKSKETKEITVQINRLIYALSEKTEEIQDIMAKIKSIVNETSMISLNATIEATRIKHINKEVTALASDVKKHVDYSVKATNKITEVIRNIEFKTRQATEMASVADHAVESQNVIIKKCSELFNQISNSSDELVAKFETVILVMEDIEANKNEVMNLTEEISSETEEIAAMTEELNASAQEQRNTMDNLTINADELKKSAADLVDAVHKFNL
jgi:methyl-accepting chemotaxis protein